MEDDDGWEDAAFNTRHLHNHNDWGRAGNVRHEFQVRNTMGTHLVTCAALDRLQQGAGATGGGGGRRRKAGPAGKASTAAAPKKKAVEGGDVVLDIYRLADDEDGLLGSLRCGTVFEASAVFAGSRKTLAKIARQLGGAEPEQPEVGAGSVKSKARDKGLAQNGSTGSADGAGSSGEEVDSDEIASESSEGRRRQRVATFEKNSFRQPKFWFRWQGIVAEDASPAVTTDDEEPTRGNRVHGSGYLVFSGNNCRRFQGTMTSEQMGWNNVKLTGWKTRPQPERDFEITWSVEP